MEGEACPLCGVNKTELWNKVQQQVFDGSTFYGKPLKFWLDLRRVLAEHQIETPEELGRRLALRSPNPLERL